jgi:hypothetical protein
MTWCCIQELCTNNGKAPYLVGTMEGILEGTILNPTTMKMTNIITTAMVILMMMMMTMTTMIN